MSHLIQGRCRCGNVSVSARLSRPPQEFTPRACDCSFCRAHHTAYVSDADGQLVVSYRDSADLARLHQGSGTVDFLACRRCNTLIGALWSDDGHAYAALNSQMLDNPAILGAPQPASPQSLPLDERKQRWRRLWFADVQLRQESAG